MPSNLPPCPPLPLLLQVVTRRCAGYIPSQVAFHLMNVHISPRKIWLSRHSEGPDTVRARGTGACGSGTPAEHSEGGGGSLDGVGNLNGGILMT